MTAQASAAFVQDCTPAEVILNLKDNEIMRLSYKSTLNDTALERSELYIWICPMTGFFEGLQVFNKNAVSSISERPLNTPQLLLFINNTSFRDGSDIIELDKETKVEDLQRLHKLIQKVT